MGDIFITGGTGYFGRSLLPQLLERGHRIRALSRPQSQDKLPPGCQVVLGNALDSNSYKSEVPPADTFVHLIGVPHPSPLKAELFRKVDLVSVQAAVEAATATKVAHFVYVSVAQPAPVMKAYLAVRAECEAVIRNSGLNATFVRPWYVLGPGHRWAYALLPFIKSWNICPRRPR